MHRVYYRIYLIVSHATVWVFRMYFSFLRASRLINKKQDPPYNKIAALPYMPINWPGGEDRIARWKTLFEKAAEG